MKDAKQTHTTESGAIARMIGLREAAADTGLSYDCLRKLCLQRRIAHIRAGKKILVNADALVDYLTHAGIEADAQ